MHVLYIGNNEEQINHFSNLFERPLFHTNSLFQARSHIFEQLYNTKQPIFIFVELADKEKTDSILSQLRKNSSLKQFLILIAANKISRETAVHYLQAGVCEIVSPDITKEYLEKIIHILPQISKQNHTVKKIEVFKLPLWKRCFDIFFSICALLGLSPLLLLTALAIRLESRGPVIYTSQRVGSNYKIFGFLKFRSMYKDAEQRLKEYQALNQYQEESSEQPAIEQNTDNNTAIFVADDFHLTEAEYLARRKKLKTNNFFKLQNDPRITHIGKIIRKFSIDELPQLINILKGDMSVVGNRPLPLYEAEQLTSDEYIERFMAPSGLTGLWQVEKRGREGILSPEERKQLDIIYAKKFSFWFDLKIICRTFTAFIQKENV